MKSVAENIDFYTNTYAQEKKDQQFIDVNFIF